MSGGDLPRVTSHLIPGTPPGSDLRIEVIEAAHSYIVRSERHGSVIAGIDFQNGPIPEKGVNGLTMESLLAICANRLDTFQRGPHACKSNELALFHIDAALQHLHGRTRERLARGVEGTMGL